MPTGSARTQCLAEVHAPGSPSPPAAYHSHGHVCVATGKERISGVRARKRGAEWFGSSLAQRSNAVRLETQGSAII